MENPVVKHRFPSTIEMQMAQKASTLDFKLNAFNELEA